MISILTILSLPCLMVLTATAIAIPMTIVEKIVEIVEKRRFRRNIMMAKYMDGEEKAIYIAETLNKYREEMMK